MTDADATVPDRTAPFIRLLVLPFLVYLAWLLELFLLAGNTRLFARPETAGMAIYTAAGCIFTGMIIPLLIVRRSFVTGAVNMFQIGFRTLRRTVLACSVTAAIVFGVILAASPFGADRVAFATAFLFVLPTALATVMVCWVLAGTHVQAFVRRGGAAVSVTSGTVMTGLMVAVSLAAAGLVTRQGEAAFWPVIAGLIAALFFFAIRDVWATGILVACAFVLLGADTLRPVLSAPGLLPGTAGFAILSIAALVAVHVWLFRNYATIVIPERS